MLPPLSFPARNLHFLWDFPAELISRSILRQSWSSPMLVFIGKKPWPSLTPHGQFSRSLPSSFRPLMNLKPGEFVFWLSWIILDDVGWFGLDQIGWFHIDLGWYRMILEDTVVDFDDIGRYWMMVRNAWQPKARSQDALGCWRTGTWQGHDVEQQFPTTGWERSGESYRNSMV